MFALSSQSKDFCEAFVENGLKVDYPFQFIPPNGSHENNYWLLVIGSDYWIIEETKNKTSYLKSTQSQTNNLFKSEYKSPFSVWNRNKYETAFIKVIHLINRHLILCFL